MEDSGRRRSGRNDRSSRANRACRSRASCRLQKEIWGFDEIELLPVRLFVVATKVGGQVFGAFDGVRMIGFCSAFPGMKARAAYPICTAT